MDWHRSFHGICPWPDPAARRHFRATGDCAAPYTAHPFPDAYYLHYFRDDWLVSRGSTRICRTSLAGVRLGRGGADTNLVTLMTIQGLGFLTPVNVFVCFELQKDSPDLIKINRWMNCYFFTVASQGAMQVAIIVVMARFRTGV